LAVTPARWTRRPPTSTKNQNVEPLERDRLDGEEVDCEHAVGLLAQERPPGRAGTLTGGTDARLMEDLPDSRRKHFQADPVDLASDPLVAPTRVPSSQAEHEAADLVAQRRTACSAGVGPAAGNEPPVPAQQRGRRHDE